LRLASRPMRGLPYALGGALTLLHYLLLHAARLRGRAPPAYARTAPSAALGSDETTPLPLVFFPWNTLCRKA
jgi:hypothetical protein